MFPPQRPDPPVRVLVVDDDPLVVEVAGSLIERDVRLVLVGTAGTVQAALAWFEGNETDAVLLDHDLPDGDAGDVVSFLRPERPAVRIVLHTARPDALARHLELMTDAVASKGADWRGLLDQLAR